MEQVYQYIKMGGYIKVNFRKIKKVDSVFKLIPMGIYISETF